jgi:hypothetical protein
VIFEAAPAKWVKERFGNIKYLRVIEVGKPAPAWNPLMKALRVPVKMEIEVKGERKVESFTPFVRPPSGQPDRRVICGGI